MAAKTLSHALSYRDGSQSQSGGISGSRTPPRNPDSAMNSISFIASSRSFGKISPMPARRSGSSAQKSTSQRLCARMPAKHIRVLFGARRLCDHDALAVERGHGVRENHLPHNTLAILVVGSNVVIPVPHFLLAVMLLRRVFYSRHAIRQMHLGLSDRDILNTERDFHPHECPP